MKVPSLEEAHKTVSDADLGVGCVIDGKELMLARFVFENSPVRSPDLFRRHLQQIVDAAAAEQILKQSGTADQFVAKAISSQTYSVNHLNATTMNGLNAIENETRSINAILMLGFGLICFILGIILYKLS
jgi:hypothetical protein